MKPRTLALLGAFLLGVLAGWRWPTAATPSPPVRTTVATATPPRAAPTPAPVLAPARPPAATAGTPASAVLDPPQDPALRWPHSQRLQLCAYAAQVRRWSPDAAGPLDRDEPPEVVEAVAALFPGADRQWHAAADAPAAQDALLAEWNRRLPEACAAYGPIDEDALYRSARAAALAGPAAARRDFLTGPPLLPGSTLRRLDLWRDWAALAPGLLDTLVAEGDAEGLYLRGLARGFDAAVDPEFGDALDPLLASVPDDPAAAAADLRAYLASGEAAHRVAAQALLAQLAATVQALPAP